MNEELHKLALTLKKVRLQKGHSQHDVSFLIGASYSTISRFERLVSAPKTKAVIESIKKYTTRRGA